MEEVIKEIMGLVDKHAAALDVTNRDFASKGFGRAERAAIESRLRQALQCKGCAVQEGYVPMGAMMQINESTPDALRYAAALECDEHEGRRKAAACLRAQHASINELREQLEAIGAGGVEPLRKPVQAVEPELVVEMSRKIAELQDQLAAPHPLHQHLLHMLGASSHEEAGAIIAKLHACELAAGQQAVSASVIAGAVFDFAGYLTTRPKDKPIHCSEVHEASSMVEALTDWAKKRDLDTTHTRVETWRDALAAHPTQQELEQVKQAVRDYHYALDTRHHGGIAAAQALDAVQEALGMRWQQGQEAAARAALAKQGEQA